jgi:flagellar basal body P-ring formation protein FlgA
VPLNENPLQTRVSRRFATKRAVSQSSKAANRLRNRQSRNGNICRLIASLFVLVSTARPCLNQCMRTRFILLVIALLVWPIATSAGQDPLAISKAIDEFMQVQIKGLPGNASYSIGVITKTENLKVCQNLQVGLPKGGRLWGKTNVTVRCEEPQGWTLYVPVRIKVIGNYLVSSHALRQGQIISAEDIATQNGDLTELPNGNLTDTQAVLGSTLGMSIAAGYPLRSDLVRQAQIVRQGQTVKVVSRGGGFEVANEGEALNNAAAGQLVRVRLGNGQLVSGIADKSGSVLVAY